MRRREFMTLVGGAAVAWPVEARAQQAERMRRIGVLMNLAESDPEGRTRLAAFVQRLEELGWAAGSNIRFDIRWAAGSLESNRRYANELAARAPDVILAYTSASVGALQQTCEQCRPSL